MSRKDGTLGSVAVTDGGSNYTNGNTATVTFSGGVNAGGTNATATAVVSGGAVQSITITNPGSKYTTLPTGASVPSGGSGTGLTITAKFGNRVTAIKVTNNGSGYTSAPTATISSPVGGGTLATVSVSFTKDVVNDKARINAATEARLGNRMLRKNMRFRMNELHAAALSSENELTGIDQPLKEVSFDFTRPLASDDYVVGQDYIIEPDDDGFAEFPVSATFARMNVRTANSLRAHLEIGGVYKADCRWLGPYVNSETKREMLIKMPSLQIMSWKAPITGHQQVRPSAEFKMRQADVPIGDIAGFDSTLPAEITLINARGTRLIDD